MGEINAAELRNYITQISQIIAPTSRTTYSLANIFSNLNQSIDLLLRFVYSSDTDPRIERFGDDFTRHLNVIIKQDLNDYPIAIEGLAQKFEAFLKKIGYLIYKTQPEWGGDNTHTGIIESNLNTLIQGNLPPKRSAPPGTSGKPLNPKLFNNNGLSNELVNFLKSNIRNDVHIAPLMSPLEKVERAQYVIFSYLLIIQDNTAILKERLLLESTHKKTLQINYSKWEQRYFQSNLLEQDVIDLVGISPFVIETDWNSNVNSGPFTPKQGKILDILTNTKQLVIIGDPGLGKTTTLQFIAQKFAQVDTYFPLYYPIKDFIAQKGLLEQITDFSGLSPNDLFNYTEKGSIVFLLDGMNEVLVASEFIILRNQLKQLLRSFSESYFVITTRPSAYRNYFNLPAFELQPLSDLEIDEFITQNYTSLSATFINALKNQEGLRELCRNPLILVILGELIKIPSSQIPTNKGLILKSFIATILKREQEKNELFDHQQTFQYLIRIATFSRLDEKLTFEKSYLLQLIAQAAEELDPQVNRLTVITSFTELRILREQNGQFSFTHELYQEYLAAEGLNEGLVKQEVFHRLKQNNHWEQPFILYSGLLSDPDEFIVSLSSVCPLLAVKCLESSANNTSTIKDAIKEVLSRNIVEMDNIKKLSESIEGLLRLNEQGLANESISKLVTEHGAIAFRYLGQIATVLMKNTSTAHLISSIRLMISIRKDFVPAMLRNLEKRNIDELLRIKNELIQVFLPYLFGPEVTPAFAYRFFRLLNIHNPDEVGRGKLEKCILRTSKQDYSRMDVGKNNAWNLIQQFNLNTDRTFMKKVLDLLIHLPTASHLYIYNISVALPELMDEIISKCLLSRNLASVCTGIYLAEKFSLTERFERQLNQTNSYSNGRIRRNLNMITDTNSFEEQISGIFHREAMLDAMLRLAHDKKITYDCKVHTRSNKMLVLKQKPSEGTWKILPSELENQDVQPGQRINVRLAFIDYAGGAAYFTQKEHLSVDYYNFCKAVRPGDEFLARIIRIEENESELQLKHIIPVWMKTELLPKNKKVGQSIKVRIESFDHGLYRVVPVLHLKQSKLETTSKSNQKKQKFKKPPSKTPHSDFATLLKNALIEGGSA